MNKMKQNIKKTWPIVAIIVSIVGIGLRYGTVLFSQGRSAANAGTLQTNLATADLVSLQHQTQRFNALLGKEQVYQQRLAESQAAVANWEKSLWTGTPEQATVELVAFVEKLATQAGLVITNKALHPLLKGATVEGWKRIGMTFEGQTGYLELTTFYDELILSAQALFLEEIELRLDEYNGRLRFRISLYSFTR